MKKRKEKSKLGYGIPFWTTFALLSAVLILLYARMQFKTYEDGILEIYAIQQDAYVQLVLDQINLSGEEATEEDIQNIIGTLDGSVNRYWTLSNREALIFVRDVTDTNKYKGLTNESYFVSDSARAFIDSLSVNQVKHGMIDLQERRYIASGVRFEFQDALYQICLLTNPETVLEQNSYLSAKMDLSIMIAVVVLVFLITVMGLGRSVAKRGKELIAEQENNKKITKMVEGLNVLLAEGDLYDARLAFFQISYLELFLEKLETRNFQEWTFLVLRYRNEEAKEFFLKDSYLMLDTNVIRFSDADRKLILLAALNYDKAQAQHAISWILYKDLWMEKVITKAESLRMTREQLIKVLICEEDNAK